MSNLRPFPYSGRQSDTIHQFLEVRPDLKELFVYELMLSSGEMLYSCAGGIGATKEPYMIKMHQFFGLKGCVKIIQETFAKEFGGVFSRTRYLLLREKFNEKAPRLSNYSDCARLYLLWVGSRFMHRYRLLGYDGTYHPGVLNLDHLGEIHKINREKRLLFRAENHNIFSEFLINEGVFLYMYLPTTYGNYGAGFMWSEEKAFEAVDRITQFVEKDYKVCICLSKRKSPLYDMLLPILPQTYDFQFKDVEWSSDLYLLNF